MFFAKIHSLLGFLGSYKVLNEPFCLSNAVRMDLTKVLEEGFLKIENI